MKRSATREAPEVQVEARGHMPSDAVRYARAKVLSLLGQVREPVLYARVKLAQMANPAMEHQAIAQATVDANGRLARAHVAAETIPEAIDLLQDRLSRQLERLNQHWEARRGGVPTAQPGQWRHTSEPTHRPRHFPRPVQERQIVRHKSFSLPQETPDEAAFEMDAMDYDFHLFTDVGTGQDSVLYREGPTGYRLAQVQPQPHLLGPTAIPLTVSRLPAPQMTVADAQLRLDISGFPFVFFTDRLTGRGNVLYHRYDGHYGLITPAD